MYSYFTVLVYITLYLLLVCRSGAAVSGGNEDAARREQERLDEEVARSLQAEEDERIARQQAGAGNQRAGIGRPTRSATAGGGNDGGKCSLQ